MFWEIFTIIAASISIIAGYITIKEYFKSKKIIKTWRSLIIFLALIIIPVGIYFMVENRHVKEIDDLMNEYFILDSKISAGINNNYTNSYRGALSKLSLLIGYYERHPTLYKNEVELLRQHHQRFDSLYTSKYLNKQEIIYSAETDEVEEVVETVINNINTIIKEQNKFRTK